MKKINIYWLIAGVLNLFTAFLHTVGGQIDLINPMLKTTLEDEVKTQLLGVWHMVTITLFLSTIIILLVVFKNKIFNNKTLILIGYLYILFSIPFIIVGIIYSILVPQWILLLPIGILLLIGNKRFKVN